MFKKTSMWVGLTAVVLASCGGGSSETTDTAVSSSTERARNTLVGGFGTDGSGFADVALNGSSYSNTQNLTLNSQLDGSTNIAFIERGLRDGVAFNTLVQAHLLANGSFDMAFGQSGFIKIELPSTDARRILFDSKGNLLLWFQTYVEIPGSGATQEENNWKDENEVRAFTFGGSTPNSNYGTGGVLSLNEIAPDGINDLVMGVRGKQADGLTLLRYLTDREPELVTITGQGKLDATVANGGVNLIPAPQHPNWNTQLADTSLISGQEGVTSAVAGTYSGPAPTDCDPYEYCPGPVLGLDFALNQGAVKGSTTEIDDLLDGGDGEVINVFVASIVNEALPNLIVTARNYQNNSITRGVLNTKSKQWNAVTHFSFFDNLGDESNTWLNSPQVAPIGNALVAFYEDYEKSTSGLMACIAPIGVCDVTQSSTLVNTQNIYSWPHVSDMHIDAQGKMHTLVAGLTVASAETNVVVDLASDGVVASAQVEKMPASLLSNQAVAGNSWTQSDYVRLTDRNAIYVRGYMNPPGYAKLPAISTITKTASGRAVSQEKYVTPRPNGVGLYNESNLTFDAKGNEYTRGSKNNISGIFRVVGGTRALDTTYGENGFVALSTAPNPAMKCSFFNYDVTAGGEVLVVQVVSDLINDRCDELSRRVTAVTSISPAGVTQRLEKIDPAFGELSIDYDTKILFSPITKEFYLVTDRWELDKTQEDVHRVVIRRYGPSGALDLNFGTEGVLTYDSSSPLDSTRAFAVDNEGRLIFAGIVEDENVISLRTARLKLDGTLDAGVDIAPPPPPTPSEKQVAHEEERQTAALPQPEPQQQATSAQISGAVAIGDGSIAVTWFSNAAANNATFTVTALPGGKTCTSTTNTCVVKGLDAWQKYTFTVAQAGETFQSSVSSEVQPMRSIKIGSRVSIKTYLKPASKGAAKYAVTGGCKLSKSTTLLAPKKAGTCLLTVKTAKVGKTAANTRSVFIQIVAALPK